ncbi:unnamed protein product [Calypogeia fissa]
MVERQKQDLIKYICTLLGTVLIAGDLLLLSEGRAALPSTTPDYGTALELSLLFFEAQRSGYLPSNQRVTWRGNSGLDDGQDQDMDLTGGYYDAGDNVKFQLPMAFTITTLAWSVIEYREQLGKLGQLDHALNSIRWGTDYFIKAHPSPNLLWSEVGDGDTDHYCWQRPEDMTTSRRAYKVDEENPGSEVAGETAAAMAAAAIVFKHTDPNYAYILLNHAKQLFTFADQHRGRYDASIPVVKRYYPSISGYGDELLWAAFWLFEATGDRTYLNYTINNADELGGTGWAMNQFGWDVKYAGLQVLASKILLEGRGGEHDYALGAYQAQASYFLCACLNKNDGRNVKRSPGGLFWIQAWNNMQFVTSAAFLLTVYTDYLTAANQTISCPDALVQPDELLTTAQRQIDYILGDNPMGTSYMVGFTQNYPKEVHHRGSSIVSIHSDSSPVECTEGYAQWYKKPEENPNLLLGALVGGPDANDHFADQRVNFEMTEACLYNNGPLVGVLARLSGGQVGQYDPSVEMIIQPLPRSRIIQPWQTENILQIRPNSPPPPEKKTHHPLPRKIRVLVQEWQRTTALMEEKVLSQRWEGVWIQLLGFTWLLYKCLVRLITVWFMYGGLKSKALIMFSKSLSRRLIYMSLRDEC